MNHDLNKLTGIAKLLAVMTRLRDTKEGCPWDVAQDFATITKYTLEEVYEVVEAIERQDMPALKEELGDLLFQIVFYAQMASEKQLFDFNGIAQSTADKMIERHPHVFNGMKLEDSEALMKMWEADKAAAREKKAREEGRTPSLLDDVSTALPSLTRAVKLQSRAARGGFEWKTIEPVLNKLEEEINELKEVIAEKSKAKEPLPLDVVDRLTEELGDVLFVAANIGRVLKIDPELALRTANRKFERRFKAIEEALAAQNRKPQDASLQELTDLWNKIRKSA
jgi:nucleoside triphosphate diphosphatase